LPSIERYAANEYLTTLNAESKPSLKKQITRSQQRINTEGTSSLPYLVRPKLSVEHVRDRSRDNSMLNFRIIKAKRKEGGDHDPKESLQLTKSTKQLQEARSAFLQSVALKQHYSSVNASTTDLIPSNKEDRHLYGQAISSLKVRDSKKNKDTETRYNTTL
jgi:hypothetical protein